MIRVGFVIGGYPPEEHKRRADVALSYSTAEVEVGIVDVEASPYFYGMTPAEIQLVAPAFIESFRRAEREGYDAIVPLGTLDLGVDGGKSAVDIPVIGPTEACLHIASLIGDQFGVMVYHPKLVAFSRAIVRRYRMLDRIAGVGGDGTGRSGDGGGTGRARHGGRRRVGAGDRRAIGRPGRAGGGERPG